MPTQNPDKRTDKKTDSSGAVIIKKYANRRLYNTNESKYITLETLAHMIHDDVEFRVVDAKTDKDITQSVLIQIIADMEEKKESLMPVSFLRQLIRLYDDNLNVLVPSYLEKTMGHFAANQSQLREYMDEYMATSPFTMFSPTEAMAQNRDFLTQALSLFPIPHAERNPEEDSGSLDTIQDQLQHLQDQLDAIRHKK